MRVRAIKPGYYDLKVRSEDDVFSINDEKEFSPKWMETVDAVTETAKPVRDDRRKPIALSKLNKSQAIVTDDQVI